MHRLVRSLFEIQSPLSDGLFPSLLSPPWNNSYFYSFHCFVFASCWQFTLLTFFSYFGDILAQICSCFFFCPICREGERDWILFRTGTWRRKQPWTAPKARRSGTKCRRWGSEAGPRGFPVGRRRHRSGRRSFPQVWSGGRSEEEAGGEPSKWVFVPFLPISRDLESSLIWVPFYDRNQLWARVRFVVLCCGKKVRFSPGSGPLLKSLSVLGRPS